MWRIKIIREFQYIEVLELDLFFCLSRSPVLPFLPGLTPFWACGGSSTCLLPSSFWVVSANGKVQEVLRGEGTVRPNIFPPCFLFFSDENQLFWSQSTFCNCLFFWVPESFFPLVLESLEVMSDPSLPALDFSILPCVPQFCKQSLSEWSVPWISCWDLTDTVPYMVKLIYSLHLYHEISTNSILILEEGRVKHRNTKCPAKITGLICDRARIKAWL